MLETAIDSVMQCHLESNFIELQLMEMHIYLMSFDHLLKI